MGGEDQGMSVRVERASGADLHVQVLTCPEAVLRLEPRETLFEALLEHPALQQSKSAAGKFRAAVS